MDEQAEQPRYEISVRGHLGETVLAAFPDLRAHAHGGETVLAGKLPDQAALHGVLAQIDALALELLEVRRVPQGGATNADQPNRTTTAHPPARKPRHVQDEKEQTAVSTQAEDNSGPTATAGGWGLRYPGLVMGQGGRNEVKEFTGMWPLKPDADLELFTKVLAPGGWVNPPGESFSVMTTKLGLIRTARWFVVRTQDFEGYSLFFISQFDGTLEKYFDDFVLNGKENLAAIWGQCVGCPTGSDVSAREIVEYIAHGQIKTLACYDVFPSLSIGQVYKAADWYEKTQKFQRDVAKGEGDLEGKVNAFFQELASPYEEVPSDAVIDTDVGRQWQYEDVGEHLSS